MLPCLVIALETYRGNYCGGGSCNNRIGGGGGVQKKEGREIKDRFINYITNEKKYKNAKYIFRTRYSIV